MPESGFAYFLNVASLVIIAFSVHLLILRSVKHAVYLPLAVCLSAVAVLLSQPVVKVLLPSFQVIFLLLSLPALYLIPPCFWLYVQGITSETSWQFTRAHRKHFILSGVAGLIVVSALLLPSDIRHQLLVIGNDRVLESTATWLRYGVYGLLILTFMLVLGWVVQAGFYIQAAWRLLQVYRQQLRNVFASTETQEARWIGWIILMVSSLWLMVAASIVYDNLIAPVTIEPVFKNVVALVLIWSVAVWGLRQKPGFETLYQQKETDISDTLTAGANEKYQRSALNKTLCENIERKLNHAMDHDQLFLDASLSLPKLASHIASSANYISQTLNETMGVNFFDYVNRYRVNAAKERLLNTNETVIDIAMNTGFNAKSSFYTAFKKETNMTPSAYRKANKAG